MKLKLPRASITVRLLSSLLVASLAPLIVVGIISYHTARSIIQDEVSSYTQQIISEQRDYLDLMLDEVEGLIGNVSKLEDVGDVAVSQDARIGDETSLRIQTEIEGILKGYTHLRGRVSVDIFAPDGERIHAGDIPGLPATGTAEVSRLYADTLASHLPVYWAGFFPYSQTGAGNAPAITAASVLHPFGSGAAGGTLLLVNLSVDCLYDHFAGSNSGDGGYLAIIDDDGRIIFHPDRMRIGGQFGGDFGHWFTADHGSFVGVVDGRAQFVTYSRSAVSGWTLLSFVPVERLAASTSRISQVTILIGSVFACLILLLALAMSREITGPISRITGLFKQLQAGAIDPATRLAPGPNDEIGDLICWFNAFLDSLEARRQAEQAERVQRTLAEALRDTAAALTSTLSYDEVLERILANVGRVVPHEAATVMLVDKDVARVVRSRGHDGDGCVSGIEKLALPVNDAANLRTMAQTGRPLAVADTRAFPGWIDCSPARWIRSMAGAPIHIKGQLIGFLTVDSGTPGYFSQEDAERLQIFANQAAIAIANARLYEQVHAYMTELEQRVAERTAELSETAARLQAANARLQEVDLLKSQFVSNVSHELRTPLANIKLYLSLFERGKPGKQAHYLATLNREADLLHRLIDGLLDLSRLDLGKVQPSLSPVDVNELVSNLAGDRRALIAERGLSLQPQVSPATPPALADPEMLIQVLTNLMTNAMNYTPAGGTIILRTDARPALQNGMVPVGDPWVTVQVSDTGPGIPAEEQAHLFDRFYRGEAARASRVPGTGLGLAICHEIVERLSGKITIDSVVGQGSTFTVWLRAAGQGRPGS